MYKKKSIPLSLKALVWNKYIGEEKGTGYCQCCRKNIIKQISFHCGHIISERNGGSTTLNNLIPLCQTCNLSMGKQNMNDFVKTYGFHENELDNESPKRTINKIKKNKLTNSNLTLNNNIDYNSIVINDNEMNSDEMNYNEFNSNTKNNFTNSSNLDYEDCQAINFLTMYFNTKKNKL
jgi:hypothetical protein